VDKTGDSRYLSAKGLHIENSSVLNTDYAIRNTSRELLVKSNWLEGDIISAGICNSRWLSNYIKANTIVIQSPIQSTRMEENLFENSKVQFYGPNELTYLLCNTWKNTGSRDSSTSTIAAIAFDNATLPDSWGDLHTSSGNRHLDQINPFLIAQDNLTNYFFAPSADQHFSYDTIASLLIGKNSLSDRDCAYNYPTQQPSYDPDFVISQMNFPDEIYDRGTLSFSQPPETKNTPINTRNQSTKEENEIQNNHFIIYQNLSDQCFTIESIDKHEGEIFLKIFNLQGLLIQTVKTSIGNSICLDNPVNALYIVNIYDEELNIVETHKLVLN